jgi:hypothetical protein
LSISAVLKSCYVVQRMIWIKVADMGREGAPLPGSVRR